MGRIEARSGQAPATALETVVDAPVQIGGDLESVGDESGARLECNRRFGKHADPGLRFLPASPSYQPCPTGSDQPSMSMMSPSGGLTWA